MEEMEIISDLKNSLLIFKYPLANTMTDDELAQIFNRSNRCFLVSWIINLLLTACGSIIENMENTEYYLGNLLHEMGLCKKSDSMPFMKGELTPNKQVRTVVSK